MGYSDRGAQHVHTHTIALFTFSLLENCCRFCSRRKADTVAQVKMLWRNSEIVTIPVCDFCLIFNFKSTASSPSFLPLCIKTKNSKAGPPPQTVRTQNKRYLSWRRKSEIIHHWHGWRWCLRLYLFLVPRCFAVSAPPWWPCWTHSGQSLGFSPPGRPVETCAHNSTETQVKWNQSQGRGWAASTLLSHTGTSRVCLWICAGPKIYVVSANAQVKHN